MDRRSLLKNTLIGSTLLGVQLQFSTKAFASLGIDQKAVLRNCIKTIVTDRPEFIEKTLENFQQAISFRPEDVQEELSLLMDLLANKWLCFLLTGTLQSVDKMTNSEVEDFLKGFATSRIAFKRQAYMAIKRLIMVSYWTESAHWGECGYPGPEGFLS